MRLRTTLILAALGLAAALFFLLVEQPRHAREMRRTEEERRFTPTDPDDVYAVSIERPDVGISAVRSEGHWTLTSPVADRADDSAFNVLVLTICRAEIDRVLDVDEKLLADFGLAPPSATILLKAGDGRNLLELRVGDLNPPKSFCYAITPGSSGVLLLPSGVRRYALHPLFEYRDKRIIDVEVDEVDRMQIVSRSDSMTWVRGEGGRWFTFQNGDTIRGDETSIEDVVRHLRGLRALDIPFGVAAPAAGAATDALGSIRLWIGGPRPSISLSFGVPRGDSCEVAAYPSGRAAVVDTSVVALLRLTADDLRDKRVLDFAEDVAVKVVWERGGNTLAIVGSDGTWRYTNPAFGQVSESAAQRLVKGLAALRYTAIIDERFSNTAGYGFETPLLHLTLLDADGRVIDEAWFGSLTSDGTSRFVHSHSSDALAIIDSASVTRLEEDLAELGGP